MTTCPFLLADGKVDFLGLDEPAGEVVDFRGGVLVVKIPGHRYQSGRGPDQRRWAPVAFRVLVDVTRETSGTWFGTEVAWFSPGDDATAALARLTAMQAKRGT